MKARFFRSDAMSERLGETPEVIVEAEWFQLTYEGLRTVPDGEHVARYNPFNDAWFRDGVGYSDVVLFGEQNDDDDVATPEEIDAARKANHAVEYCPANFAPPGAPDDDWRDLRPWRVRRLGEDEYEYLRMEAKIDAEEGR